MATTQERKQAILNVFMDGSCVDVSVRYPRFERKLNAKDLGLEPQDVPEIFRLGKKLLLSKKVIGEFASIEAAARRAVEDYSYMMPIPGIKFVPNSALHHLVNKLERLKADFTEVTTRFIDRYDQMREETLQTFEKYAESIEKLYPKKSELAGSFGLDYSLFAISLPSEIEAEAVDLKHIEDAQRESQLVIQSKSRKMVEDFDKWSEDVVVKTRMAAMELFKTVKEKVERGELVHSSTVKSMKNFIDQFRMMNFVGDGRLDAALKAAEDAIDGGFQTKYGREGFVDAAATIVEAAKNTSDVSEVTGKYRRRLMKIEEEA